MPEENRVFDVAKPGRSQPQATSKPVIVGHHPVINDPMVKDTDSPAPTKISVHDDHDDFSSLSEPDKSTAPMEHHDIPVYDPPGSLIDEGKPDAGQIQTSAPAVFDSQPQSSMPIDPLAQPPSSVSAGRDAPVPGEPEPLEPAAPAGHVEALQPSHAKKRRPFKWLLAGLIILLVIIYILLGTGVIKSGLSLPPFKKKTTPAASTPPASQPPAAQSSLPAGFTKYDLSGTNITFAAPTSWGTPNSTTDPGYTKRGGTNQPDGVHAYIVDFPNKKDVEIAVTSSKYLPASRNALYYDYLQWCTGSADNKYYFATLEYSTAADKTQTPTTTACDQGPLTGVTQIDSSTIVQLALKNSTGQTIGDLYTKNLNDNAALPVMRVKDAAMTNSANIKQLLSTVQSTGSAAASSSSSGP